MALSGEDQGAILDLSARYNHSFDAGSFDVWVECFAEDGVYEAPDVERRLEGREALRKFVSGVRFPVPIRTMPTTHVIDETEDGASMVSFFSVLRLDDPPQTVAAGRYEDQLTKVGGVWRLAHRKVVVYWRSQPEGWV